MKRDDLLTGDMENPGDRKALLEFLGGAPGGVAWEDRQLPPLGFRISDPTTVHLGPELFGMYEKFLEEMGYDPGRYRAYPHQFN